MREWFSGRVWFCAVLVLVPLGLAAHPCESCHAERGGCVCALVDGAVAAPPGQRTPRDIRHFRHPVYHSLRQQGCLAAHGARRRGVGVPGRVCHRLGQPRRRLSHPDRRPSLPVANLLLHQSPRLRSGSWLRTDCRTRFHPAGRRGVRALPLRRASVCSWYDEPVHGSRVYGRGDFVRALPWARRRALEAAGARVDRQSGETRAGGSRQYLRAVPPGRCNSHSESGQKLRRFPPRPAPGGDVHGLHSRRRACLQSDQPRRTVGIERLRAQQPGKTVVRNLPRSPSAGSARLRRRTARGARRATRANCRSPIPPATSA